MFPGVELRLYRYVAAIAEELNFTRASAKLHVAQPALSRQIKQLEDYLGTLLFERDRRGVRLTPAGEAFNAEARLTLFHAQRAVDGARAAKGQQKGPWKLGYTPLLDRRILAKVRQHLSVAHPTANIQLASSYTSEQADALMRGKLQAGLVILPIRVRIDLGRFSSASVGPRSTRTPSLGREGRRGTERSRPIAAGGVARRFGAAIWRRSETHLWSGSCAASHF